MNTRNRLNSVSGVIVVALVAFVAGLVLAVWAPGNSNLPRVIGALSVLPGASQELFGTAQFIPDLQMRIAVSLCGAVVSTAAIFMVPRRSVGPKGSVR